MASHSQASFFHNAQNVSLRDSTINATIHNHDSQASGMHLLSQKISTSAMHDSSARDPPPRCHPDTRKSALETIDAFVEVPDPDEVVLWMNAPFGHGKSAVMQTVIEILRASGRGHRTAGAFFFGRDKEGRDKAHYLLPVLMYQIAHNIAGMYEHVNNAINNDPTLPSKSIEAQLIPLLVAPFLAAYPTLPHTPTIFIDGLDECDTPAAQRSVLKMIADVVSIHRLPLRFVVASRPEVHITHCFKAPPLFSITRAFGLDDDFESMVIYFRHEFNRILETRSDDMAIVPKPWPSYKIIRDLVRRASGQYLFASTVIRFVGDEYDHPVEQLQVLLSPHPRQASAFSSMDTLYTQILSVCPIRLRESLLHILGLVVSHEDEWVNIAFLSDLLELPSSDVSTAIRGLQAILEIKPIPILPPHNTDFSLSSFLSPTVSSYHVSLKEFLTDKARAGDFWVDLDVVQTMLLRRSDLVLASSISDSASSMTIHPATWKHLLWPSFSVETSVWDASSWPLFTREFSKYRDDTSPQSIVAGCRSQCVKAFCFLLGNWNNAKSAQHDIVSNEVFKTVQSIVAASLRQWFSPLSQESLDLFSLFTYFNSTERSMFAATSEIISKRPDLSFDAALRAINSASVFLTLDNENIALYKEYSTWDVRVCIDWSITDILTDPELIGKDIYNAHRNARILAVSGYYTDVLLHKNSPSDVFRKKAASAFYLPMSRKGILKLKCDDRAGSSIEVLINQICSPRSFAVLCNTAAFDYSTPYFFIPLFLFMTMNCLEANVLEPRFKGVHQKLSDLITTLLQAGVLAAAFSYPDYHDITMQSQNISTYQNLFKMEGFTEGQWLKLVDDKTHTSILEFFLDTLIVERFYKLNPDPRDIPWSGHFSRASYSPEITKHLMSLKDNRSTLDKVGSLLPVSFVSGLKIWKEKHLAGDLESAQAIDELSLKLSSIDRVSNIPEDHALEASGTNENEQDESSDGEYEDAVEEIAMGSEILNLS